MAVVVKMFNSSGSIGNDKTRIEIPTINKDSSNKKQKKIAQNENGRPNTTVNIMTITITLLTVALISTIVFLVILTIMITVVTTVFVTMITVIIMKRVINMILRINLGNTTFGNHHHQNIKISRLVIEATSTTIRLAIAMTNISKYQ